MKPLTTGLYLKLDMFNNEGSRIHLKKAKLIPAGVLEFLLQNSPLAKIKIKNNDD
jgi:hypothetical protein